MQVVVVYTVHLVKLFRIAELVCFSVVSHILMTAKDIADVAFDWCTADNISYEEEQKHESGEDVVVPAIDQSTQAEQLFRHRGGHQ